MTIDPNRPAWRVLAVSGFYGPDDHLYQLDDEIYFDGEPNEELEPLNEVAKLKMVNYLDKLEDLGRKAADKAGRAFAGRPRSLDGALELATAIARESVPIMIAKREVTSVGRISDGNERVPETGSITPKKRGRPRATHLISAA